MRAKKEALRRTKNSSMRAKEAKTDAIEEIQTCEHFTIAAYLAENLASRVCVSARDLSSAKMNYILLIRLDDNLSCDLHRQSTTYSPLSSPRSLLSILLQFYLS